MIGHDNIFKILVVDDSAITRMIVRHVLSRELTGPKVVIIEEQNGRKAYETALHEHIDIIFSDLHMPVMSGMEMLKRFHDEHRTPPPLIFVTSEKRPQFIDQALALGAAGIISKPFTQTSFRKILLAVLAKNNM